MTDLKTLLKDNTVSFSRYRKGYLYYTIAEPSQHNPLDLAYLPTATYEFPVPIEDCGDATFPATDKAITQGSNAGWELYCAFNKGILE